MITYTSKYDIQHYFETAQVGDLHLAIYPTCWFIRKLTHLNADLIQGTNIRSNDSYYRASSFSFNPTHCAAICIIPLNVTEVDIFTLYPELLV